MPNSKPRCGTGTHPCAPCPIISVIIWKPLSPGVMSRHAAGSPGIWIIRWCVTARRASLNTAVRNLKPFCKPGGWNESLKYFDAKAQRTRRNARKTLIPANLCAFAFNSCFSGDYLMTDLAQHIQQIKLIDTHEHLRSEQEYVENGPDVLGDLFNNYVLADLISAGATQQAVNALTDTKNPDIEARWNGIKDAWAHCQFTGYGEAVRLIAKDVYGMEEITLAGIEAGAKINQQRRQPGERLRILRDEGNLDHVQTDDFCWPCLPDASGVDFFLYDLSWASFCDGSFDVPALVAETGCEVRDLNTLRLAMSALFAKYGPNAIAVKAQHAYDRTLMWQERTDAEVAPILARHLRSANLTVNERLCLGEWCWARGVELAIEHNLPFKIHTGYYAGNNRMPVDRIKPGHLCGLLARYLDARFVLMHIAYPYDPELAAIAKHYRNVYVDLCWAWSIDPYS